MRTKRFLSLSAIFAIALAFFACSSDTDPSPPPGGEPSSDSGNASQQVEPPPQPPPSSSSFAPPPPPPSSSSILPPSSSSRPSSSSSSRVVSGYCDYGPLVTQANGEVTGGCYPMGTADDEANCALWGNVVSSCPSSSSVAEKPSKMIIELTSYNELAVLDVGGYGDPKITVNVKSYVGDAVVKNTTTKVLLDKEDITTWTGSVKDTVEVYPTADRIVVQPIILDKDVLSNDDVSPPAKQVSADNIFAGKVFANQNFEGTQTKCTLTISLIK